MQADKRRLPRRYEGRHRDGVRHATLTAHRLYRRQEISPRGRRTGPQAESHTESAIFRCPGGTSAPGTTKIRRLPRESRSSSLTGETARPPPMLPHKPNPSLMLQRSSPDRFPRPRSAASASLESGRQRRDGRLLNASVLALLLALITLASSLVFSPATQAQTAIQRLLEQQQQAAQAQASPPAQAQRLNLQRSTALSGELSQPADAALTQKPPAVPPPEPSEFQKFIAESTGRLLPRFGADYFTAPPSTLR